MKRFALFDAESYWDEDVSVQNLCMPAYLEKSYAYLFSIVTNTGYRFAGTPQEFRENSEAMEFLLDPATDLWAVNSNFDQGWAEKEFPEILSVGKEWQCVADYSVYHQRPRGLQPMLKALTGRVISKSTRQSMKGVQWQEIMAFEQDRVKEYNLADSDDGMEALRGLRALGPMSDTEVRVAEHTRMISRRGIAVDLEFVEKCRQALEWMRFKALKLLPWGDRDKPLAAQAFNLYCCQNNVAPPANLRKDDSDFTAWMGMNPKLAPTLQARQRFELANRKLSHIESFLERVHEGIYYPDLLYCGAPHTRRWSAKGSSDGSQSGGDELHSGFNTQNMDREPLFGDLLPDFFSPLPPEKKGQPMPGIFFRNFLVPRPGKVFIVLDFSQIEPRFLRWLVKDEAFLEMVRGGLSVYEAFARLYLGWQGGDLKTENDPLYRTSKADVIGLGYGCGYRKFPMVALKMAGLHLSEEESKRAVYEFRNTNPLIVDYWTMFGQLVQESARIAETLDVVMPNKEVMHYFNVEQYVRTNEDGSSRYCYRGSKTLGDPNPRGTSDIYGGKLTENVTQRGSRDLLAEGVLRVEDAGMPVCFHSHDEVILEVDYVDREDALMEATRLMSVVPEWARGLPIGVSGGIFARYSKA